MNDIEHDCADPRFLERMNALIERCGGAGELARKAGLSRRVIDKYRRGESDPSRSRLVAMAAAAGVSVEWLAAGLGPADGTIVPMPPASGPPGVVDPSVLAGLLQVALSMPGEGRGRPGPLDVARLIVALHAELLAAYPDPDERQIGLKLQSERLRRLLALGKLGPADTAWPPDDQASRLTR